MSKMEYNPGMRDDTESYIVLVLHRDEIYWTLKQNDILPEHLSKKLISELTDEDWRECAKRAGSAIWDNWTFDDCEPSADEEPEE